MTLEQLAQDDVYEGDLDEELEQETFGGTGVLRVILQPSASTLRMLNVGELTLDVANINCRLTVEKEIEAWTREQANDLLWEYVKNEEYRVEQQLEKNGVDARVEAVSDETWVSLNN